MNRQLVTLVAAWMVCGQVLAEGVSYRSGVQQTGLLELYTSEGCSSCPPADRWLSSLKDDDGLWQELIPVAFHVDYWDYLGWRDRFAARDFSQRQRRYAAEQSMRTVEFTLSDDSIEHAFKTQQAALSAVYRALERLGADLEKIEKSLTSVLPSVLQGTLLNPDGSPAAGAASRSAPASAPVRAARPAPRLRARRCAPR